MAPGSSNRGSVWIEPAGLVKPEIVTLSATDNQCARVYPCAFWFFPENPLQRDGAFHFEQMRRGLARLIYQQPLNCGIIREDERGDFSVEIPSAPNAGTTLHYNDVSNDPTFPTMQQIADAKYPVMDGHVDGFNELRPEPFPTSSDGDPVWACQVTKLRGGIVVFASTTHLIGDLLQPRMSLCGWAEQVRLVAEAYAAGLPEPPLPKRLPDILFDRSMLSPTMKKEMSYKEVQKVCDKWGKFFVLDPTEPLISAERMKSTFPQAYLRPSEVPNEQYLRGHIGGLWSLSPDVLKTLVYLAKQHTDAKISTIDVVMGFLWQRFYICKYAVMAGKEACQDRPERPALVFPGDIRTRLNPPLPQMYLGSAVWLFKARLTEKEFLPQENTVAELGRSLAAAAVSVRKANSQFDQEEFMKVIEMTVSTPLHVPFLPKGPLDILITDHTRNAPLRTADWGPGLGKTPELRQPYFGRDMPPGEVTLMPRLNNGGIEVMITAERVVLQRLCEDPVFKRFAETIFMAYNVREALCPQYSASNPPVPRL